jgi:hypothetical protein
MQGTSTHSLKAALHGFGDIQLLRQPFNRTLEPRVLNILADAIDTVPRQRKL